MRLLVDLASHIAGTPAIVQTQRVPTIGSDGAVAVNGRYAIPVPLDLDFPITSADYVLDGGGEIDGGDVVSKGFAHLLALYPNYGNVYFNPLLTSDHVAELVTDNSFWFIEGANSFYVRCQTGRPAGSVGDGQMPTHTALMPVNSKVSPSRPGFIITDRIDISAYCLNCNGDVVGTDEFMVFWKLYSFDVTDDVAADVGALANTNEPALRMLQETDQEPTDFSVYLTPDEGVTWTPVNLLEPVVYATKTTTVRLAFRNDSANKIFLASYGLLF